MMEAKGLLAISAWSGETLQDSNLKGWEMKGNAKSPLVGQYTNKYVYDVLPEPVIEEIKKKNPLVQSKTNNNKFHRLHRHHQYLTDNTGIPPLR